MNETGGNEPEGNGMETKIVVVDGADGLTPDMVRVRHPTLFPFEPVERQPYQDPMHD